MSCVLAVLAVFILLMHCFRRWVGLGADAPLAGMCARQRRPLAFAAASRKESKKSDLAARVASLRASCDVQGGALPKRAAPAWLAEALTLAAKSVVHEAQARAALGLPRSCACRRGLKRRLRQFSGHCLAWHGLLCSPVWGLGVAAIAVALRAGVAIGPVPLLCTAWGGFIFQI